MGRGIGPILSWFRDWVQGRGAPLTTTKGTVLMAGLAPALLCPLRVPWKLHTEGCWRPAEVTGVVTGHGYGPGGAGGRAGQAGEPLLSGYLTGQGDTREQDTFRAIGTQRRGAGFWNRQCGAAPGRSRRPPGHF